MPPTDEGRTQFHFDIRRPYSSPRIRAQRTMVAKAAVSCVHVMGALSLRLVKIPLSAVKSFCTGREQGGPDTA